MAFLLTLTIDNLTATSYASPVRIMNEFPTLKWSFDTSDRITVDTTTGQATDQGEYSQASYEIRISTSNLSIGTDAFIGNRIQTGQVNSQEFFWRYSGLIIQRGITYYGQLLVTDEAGRVSDWATFSYDYNSLPYVGSVAITPTIPAATDDLQLNYDFFDDDGDTESGTKIRWFKNGIYQRFFDNATIILSTYLQNNDIWNADVYPSDGYEFGERVTSNYVVVSKTSVTVSNLKILPQNPNENDILKADYIASDEKEQENVTIRWYVNNLLIPDLNNKIYVKPSLQEGDVVRFEVKHEDKGNYTSSVDVTIVASDFVVNDILIDGSVEPLEVSSIAPLIQWRSYIPSNKQINYVSIKIGTFYEADNIYSTVLSYSTEAFTVPHDLLKKGQDYYVVIAVSDTTTFVKYSTAHFKINGSRWETNISNSTGWTLETLFVIKTDNEDNYNFIRINDGSKFAEIRIYKSKISLNSASLTEYTYTNDVDKSNTLTVAGKNSDIKIYLNKELIIDGEGIFTQTSNIKRLELGGVDASFVVDYKYFFYTTSGYFLPGVATEFDNLQFHTFMEFDDNEIVALRGYTNSRYIFGVNPDNTNESSTIYALKGGTNALSSTVPRTFSPISDITKSPDGKKTVCSYSKGFSVISGYQISNFNNELIFYNNAVQENWPDANGWELVKTITTAANYFNEDGFNINTIG